MAAWLQPLKLETIFVNVFSGDSIYFVVIGLMIVAGMAGFFRMTTLMLFLFMGLFLLMFSGTQTNYLVIFFAIIASLVIGIVASKLKER